MKIWRGKFAGCKAKLGQFCNDWMTVDVVLADGSEIRSQVINPTSVELEPGEYDSEFAPFVSDSGDPMPERNTGSFFREYAIDKTRFKRRRTR